MLNTYAIILSDGTKHYVSASSAARAKAKLSTRFPSVAVLSCTLCK